MLLQLCVCVYRAGVQAGTRREESGYGKSVAVCVTWDGPDTAGAREISGNITVRRGAWS